VRFGQLFEEIFTISNDPRVTPFAAARPSMELMPDKALMRETRNVISRHPRACMDYCFPPGEPRLRQQIALRYSEMGLSIGADEIIITNGATEALSLALHAVARRGDVIAVESPTYFSVLRLIEKLGMLALEIDTDPQDGINFDSLEFALDTMDVTAMLVVPNFNNPSGSLMPSANKQRLVEMLQERNIPLIEDDVYGDLYFGSERPDICKHFDRNDNVLSASSFSKTLAPGFRMGWVVGGRHQERLLEWKQATSSGSPSLQQLALTEFLRSGQYDRHLERLRKAVKDQVEKARFMIARAFPEGTRISNPQGGFVLWIELPRGINCFDVYTRALEERIGITPGMLFSATRKFRNYIRINCGYPWSEDNEAALHKLGELIHAMQN
jgi:DNA-binding transcriptional MocR family regulator